LLPADEYRNEVNYDNPLGMHGKVALAFGNLIKEIWDGGSSNSYYGNSVNPREFKHVIGKFAPSFAGYGQQDTQELLAFLLDGLHEDLNRIQKKPYIEKPDWKDGGTDDDLARMGKECWEGYKKRNDSIIVDLFQGQLKSTLICPDCHKVR
jgi:ubiquitin carboxyl-terminal hydrolase 4/11/15